ncbi:MAG: hypothetical protein H6644_16905 [Caldilineaceae bacterium]|nr:hypothetical protein [Caldilineaceae bacterium]
MTSLIVWGAGELGSRIGAAWQAGPVWGYTATPARHAALAAAGIRPRTGAPSALPDDGVLVLALPGHARQGEAVRQLAARGLVAPRCVVLVSTTGIYGAPRGVVDENTLLDTDARAQSIAAVEADFRAWAGERGVVMRLGGLYGPGRGPGAALARRGSAKPGPGQPNVAADPLRRRGLRPSWPRCAWPRRRPVTWPSRRPARPGRLLPRRLRPSGPGREPQFDAPSPHAPRPLRRQPPAPRSPAHARLPRLARGAAVSHMSPGKSKNWATDGHR